MDIRKMLSLGISKDNTDEEIQKIQTANFLSFLFILIACSFTVLILLTSPVLLFIPYAFFSSMAICLFLTYIGALNFACLLISWVPMVAAGVLQASVMGIEEDLIPSLQSLLLALQITPWLCYRKEDRAYVVVAVLGGFLFFLMPIWINPLLVFSIDSSIWRSGPYFYVALINSFILLSGAIAFLNFQRNHEKKKNKELVDTLKKSGEEMTQAQAEVAASLEEIKKAKIEDDKRTWVSTGITELNHYLRIKHNDKDFYPELISRVVKYVKANQGAIFILNDDDESNIFLNMEGCYAYERKKLIEKRINIGEGAIGQCFLEGETTVIKTLPEKYISITSGLGQAQPSCLIMLPLKFNDISEGIVELASFDIFGEHQIEYLEKAGEIIASTINQIKINIKTKILLDQTKIQTEELRSQEEEMLQNMEELQATQEDAVKKEVLYLEKIKKLEEELKKYTETVGNTKVG